MQNVRNMRQIARNNTTFTKDGWQVNKQSLYDIQPYAIGGQTQLSFFQSPVGQGGKTLSDTNLTLAGQLPSNQKFLVEDIQIWFNSGASPAILGGTFGVQLNDAWIVYKAGNLKMTIGAREILQEAPLGRFPCANKLESDSSQAGIANGVIVTGNAGGRIYKLDQTDVWIPSTTAFSVQTSWPEGVQPLVSGVAGRIGVILSGYMYNRI